MILILSPFCRYHSESNFFKEIRHLELKMISSQENSTHSMVWNLEIPEGDLEERKRGGWIAFTKKALDGRKCLVRADEVFC